MLLPRLLWRAVLTASAAAVLVVAAGGPAQATPQVPDLSQQYWFGNYQISKIWAMGATGQGVTVAVLDSGVQADAPELAGVVLRGTNLEGGDGRTDTTRPDGHGTGMAILIAGQGGGPNDLTGIAPSAKILPVTVNDKSNAALGSTEAYARGIRYAADHGARVLNMSQGTDGTGEPGHCPTSVAQAVRYAIGKGAVIVASAGNEALAGNPPNFPAACPGVLAVGAVNGSKQPWPRSERQRYVDIAGPGVHIFAEDLAGEAGFADGTSDSSALVSGAIALVWSKFPTLTNRQVVARILATVADDAGTPGKDNATGYGIARPYNAITTRVPADAPNPVFDELKAAPPSAPSRSAGQPGEGSTASDPNTASTKSSSSSSLVPIVVGAAAIVVALAAAGMFLSARTRRRARAYSAPFPPQGGPPPPPYQ